MRPFVLIVTVFTLAHPVMAGQQGAPRTASAESKTPTMAENFEHYCQQGDSSIWFCKKRLIMIPDSQKWDIVGGYCFDNVASPRPNDARQTAALLETLW